MLFARYKFLRNFVTKHLCRVDNNDANFSYKTGLTSWIAVFKKPNQNENDPRLELSEKEINQALIDLKSGAQY